MLTKRPGAIGPTVQSRPAFCPTCDSRNLIKRGLRKNQFRRLQIYWCKGCGRYFSSLAGLSGVKYPPRIIARALCLYNLGYSQEEVARRIASENRVTVPRRTISDWIRGYRSITTFHRLRARAVRAFGSQMLAGRTLDHEQVYQFQVHVAKLELMGDAVPPAVAAKVRSYLLSVNQDYPDVLFQDNARAANLDQESADSSLPKDAPVRLRSSKARFATQPVSRVEKENLANDLASLGLLLARRNKDRHQAVEDFMLANDSCTIACEVPVYLTSDDLAYYREQGFILTLPESSTPVTGHIDIIQARNGYIHLLDYKPKARDIQPLSQLVVYALAFASRTRLPLKAVKCAWFDDRDYFEFFPLRAVGANR